MGDYQPVAPADVLPFTLTAGGTIVGGNLVELSASDTVIQGAGANRPIGVAAHDAVSGQRMTIWPLADLIHESPVQGTVAVAAGAPITGGTTGTVNTGVLGTLAAAGTLVGICVRGATGPAKARWIGV
jgi:hypothetical protein